jgi:hypothetical protein
MTLSTDPLSKWYTILKEAVAHIDKQEATRLYKTSEEHHKWIDNWEQGMNLVSYRERKWQQHHLLRIGSNCNWSESCAIHKGDEVEDETITFRTVANDLRKVVDKNRKGTTKFTKGFFGPTFAEAEHTEAGPKKLS